VETAIEDVPKPEKPIPPQKGLLKSFFKEQANFLLEINYTPSVVAAVVVVAAKSPLDPN